MRQSRVIKSERIKGDNYSGAALWHEDGSQSAFVSVQLTKEQYDNFTKPLEKKNASA
jgi:hypothetical protein